MGFGLRRLALACALLVAATVAVAGGSAANRDGLATFDVVPGPGRVTYGQNIAYRATFENIGTSNFTQVKFRMRVPYAQFGSAPYPQAAFVASTCPSTPVTVSTANGPEWICSFPNLGSLQSATLTVVWQAPTLASAENCDGCLKTNGRWTIKEGVNDVSDPNDAFPASGIDRSATLLSAEVGSIDPKNSSEAGGYELTTSCTDALAAGSLQTKQALALSTNPVSTTVCLPDFTIPPANGTDLGVATTIVEGPGDDGNPAGHPSLGRSDVCIAEFGQNCGLTTTVPHNFGTDTPVTFVFRILDAALPKGEKITQVFHNGQALPSCLDNPTNANGCVVSIDLSNGKVKVWTIVARAPTNGPWTW